MKFTKKLIFDIAVVSAASSIAVLIVSYLILIRMYRDSYTENEVLGFMLIPFSAFIILFPIIGVIVAKLLPIEEPPKGLKQRLIWLCLVFSFSTIVLLILDYAMYLINTNMFYEMGEALDKLIGTEDTKDSIGMFPMMIQGYLQNLIGLFIGCLILSLTVKIKNHGQEEKE